MIYLKGGRLFEWGLKFYYHDRYSWGSATKVDPLDFIFYFFFGISCRRYVWWMSNMLRSFKTRNMKMIDARWKRD
jgi:hypothetical protein